VAFFTCSFDKLKAPLRDVMANAPSVDEMEGSREGFNKRDCLKDGTSKIAKSQERAGFWYTNKLNTYEEMQS
jgi:hypothetical protein